MSKIDSRNTLIPLQVYTAAFIGHFKKVIGIEVISCLHYRGRKRIARWEKILPKLTPTIQAVEFLWLEKDFMEKNDSWRDAAFIFLHWTGFNEAQRSLVAKLLDGCEEGTHVVTLTLPIPSDAFEVLVTDTCDTSWGKAEFFFHEKITPAARSEDQQKTINNRPTLFEEGEERKSQ